MPTLTEDVVGDEFYVRYSGDDAIFVGEIPEDVSLTRIANDRYRLYSVQVWGGYTTEENVEGGHAEVTVTGPDLAVSSALEIRVSSVGGSGGWGPGGNGDGGNATTSISGITATVGVSAQLTLWAEATGGVAGGDEGISTAMDGIGRVSITDSRIQLAGDNSSVTLVARDRGGYNGVTTLNDFWLTVSGNVFIGGNGANSVTIGLSAWRYSPFSAIDVTPFNFSARANISENSFFLGEGDDTLVIALNPVMNWSMADNHFDGGDGLDRFELQFSGNGGTINLAALDLISFEQIRGGDYDDTILGTVNDDWLEGGDGNDTLKGDMGDDMLIGGAGDDYMDGGIGEDTVSFAEGATQGVIATMTSATGAGSDTMANIENLIGSEFNDRLSGDIFDNLLRGGEGDDRLVGDGGDDWLIGDSGDDVMDGGPGWDTADYSEATAAVWIDLAVEDAQDTQGAGTDTLISIENVVGSAFNDVLYAGRFGGTLVGGAGNDRIYAGPGRNQLEGGAGNDILYVNDADDVVVEHVGGGYDIVRTAANFNGSGQDIERIEIIGSSRVNVVGNALNNILIGNDQTNALNGGKGADRMEGRGGNDLYYVDNVGDVVVELAGGGIDTVRASISYTLGAEQERLQMVGSQQVNAIGNALDNVIQGNARSNVIIGMGGRDLMTGGGGADRFDFRNISDSPFAAYDRITDLEDQDVINLSRIDANTLVAGDQAFVLTSAFTGLAGQLTLTYVSSGDFTVLAADVDGDRVGDFRVILNGDHRDYDNFIL